jgi:serine/threonine protein kinase
MPLSAGVRLGPYEILDAIGAGGMGEVYRAKDTRLDRTVAIKILPAHLSSDPVRKQRFEREAKTISSLNHPNICVLHDVGQQDGIDYLVTPYPKKAFHLPSILSQEEVARLIDAALTPYHRTLLMTLYATGVRRAELTHLKVSDMQAHCPSRFRYNPKTSRY